MIHVHRPNDDGMHKDRDRKPANICHVTFGIQRNCVARHSNQAGDHTWAKMHGYCHSRALFSP